MKMDFKTALLKWYALNKRRLPWREINDPYRIWLSEIILQQTRIDQGLSYYLKFEKKYPDIYKLAEADLQEILKDWQGLGYYSRARNMHHTAKEVVDDYGGQFPDDYVKLNKLKGIGEYTAAAISSIAFNKVYPVIDGNVIRVLSRYYGIREPYYTVEGRKLIKNKAGKLIDHKDPGTYNQAIMEFGAIHCTYNNPDCNHCIFKSSCKAFKECWVDELPAGKEKVKQKLRYLHYLVFITKDHFTCLNKRNRNDIWKGLYDFPMIEHNRSLSFEKIVLTDDWTNLTDKKPYKLIRTIKNIKHQLTHQKLMVSFFVINISDLECCTEDFVKIKALSIHRYPVPKVIENFIDKYFLELF